MFSAETSSCSPTSCSQREGSATVRNALPPLRVIFRRAVEDGDVAVNPCVGLRLPAVRGRREKVVPPDKVSELLDALQPDDRAMWSLAFYAGLRLGELMGLRWEDVDLAAGVIRVERARDPKGRLVIEPKSRAGRRRVPVASVLRDTLIEYKLDAKDDYVLGNPAHGRGGYPAAIRRTARTWRAGGLDPVTLHEARHTFASLMIGARVNARALCSYMGHASVTVTFDRYGHLRPGNEDEAAALLDAYLERADTRARIASVKD